jgi:hypothetical protein
MSLPGSDSVYVYDLVSEQEDAVTAGGQIGPIALARLSSGQDSSNCKLLKAPALSRDLRVMWNS